MNLFHPYVLFLTLFRVIAYSFWSGTELSLVTALPLDPHKQSSAYLQPHLLTHIFFALVSHMTLP
jgi:hypothetical protein